jgi:hypothetical protein
MRTLRAANELLMAVTSARRSIRSHLNTSGYTDRELYTALGYIEAPTYDHYNACYRRNGIAKGVINKVIDESWRLLPDITQVGDEGSTPFPFDTKWQELATRLSLWDVFQRVDKLASIGEYSVLLIGVQDSGNLEAEVGHSPITYLQPYSQKNAAISDYDEDTSSERYGLPKIYTLNMGAGSASSSRRVHWSRVIHVAQDCLESNVMGTPALEGPLNALMDLEKIAGSAAEAFWRNAEPGTILSIEGDSNATQTDDTVSEKIEEWVHDMKRWLLLRNVKADQFRPQLPTPLESFQVALEEVSAATGIPMRILVGSERGELASTQDSETFAHMVDRRRRKHCQAHIIEPFVERGKALGELPPVEHRVEWADLLSDTDKERAEVASKLSKALKDYNDAVGAGETMPPDAYFKFVWGLNEDEIEQIAELREQQRIEADSDDDIMGDEDETV